MLKKLALITTHIRRLMVDSPGFSSTFLQNRRNPDNDFENTEGITNHNFYLEIFYLSVLYWTDVLLLWVNVLVVV